MMKGKIREIIKKVAYKEAENNANSTCAFLHNQPRVPEKVKNLRKF